MVNVDTDALSKVLAFAVKAAQTLAADQHPTAGPTAEDWAAIQSVQKMMVPDSEPELSVLNITWDVKIDAPIFQLSDGTVRKPAYSANGYGWDLGWK
jgi:hypothetical protein